MTANGENGVADRRRSAAGTVRRRGGLAAQLRGRTKLTHCDGIPWTLQGESAAAQARIELWIVVGELARERRRARGAANDDPPA
jgi:hypothetical protein